MRFDFLLTLALLLVAPAAHAQAKCAPGVPGTEWKLSPLKPQYVEGAAGRHGYYWCEDPVGNTWRTRISCSYVGNDCNLVKWMAYQVNLWLAADSAKRAIYEAAYKDAVVYQCDAATQAMSDWRGEVCREQQNILAANYKAWESGVVLPVWKVKANGAYPDRPVQRISATNGLTNISGVRVLVGALCYPVVRWFTNTAGNTYAAIDPAQPDRVAVCVKT